MKKKKKERERNNELKKGRCIWRTITNNKIQSPPDIERLRGRKRGKGREREIEKGKGGEERLRGGKREKRGGTVAGETDQMNGGTGWALRWMLAFMALFYRRVEPLYLFWLLL